MKKKITFTFWLIITILPIIGIIFSLADPISFFATQEEYRTRIEAFGVFGPLFFVLLQAAQVVFTPINHYAVGIAGGFLYGPYIGGCLNWVGRIIGHLIAFLISKKLGRKAVDRFVNPKTIAKYDKYVSNQYLILFLIYFLPFFPDDEISYLAGLSKMDFKKFAITNLLGHTGGSFMLAYIGAGVDRNDPFWWLLVGLTIIGFPLIWWLFLRSKKRTDAKSN